MHASSNKLKPVTIFSKFDYHVNIAAASNKTNSLNLSVIRKEIAVMENMVHVSSKFCKSLVTMFVKDFTSSNKLNS